MGMGSIPLSTWVIKDNKKLVDDLNLVYWPVFIDQLDTIFGELGYDEDFIEHLRSNFTDENIQHILNYLQNDSDRLEQYEIQPEIFVNLFQNAMKEIYDNLGLHVEAFYYDSNNGDRYDDLDDSGIYWEVYDVTCLTPNGKKAVKNQWISYTRWTLFG